MPFFVDVILPLPLPKLFTYQITEQEYDFIEPGIRIVVTFGNKKKYATLSYCTHQNKPPYETKSIEYIIDNKRLSVRGSSNFGNGFQIIT